MSIRCNILEYPAINDNLNDYVIETSRINDLNAVQDIPQNVLTNKHITELIKYPCFIEPPEASIVQPFLGDGHYPLEVTSIPQPYFENDSSALSPEELKAELSILRSENINSKTELSIIRSENINLKSRLEKLEDIILRNTGVNPYSVLKNDCCFSVPEVNKEFIQGNSHLYQSVKGSIESSENSANVTEFYDEDKSSTEEISVIAAEPSDGSSTKVTESYGSLTAEEINVIAAKPSDGSSTKEINVTESYGGSSTEKINVIAAEPSDGSSTKESNDPEPSNRDESSTKKTNRPSNKRFTWSKEALKYLFLYLKEHKEKVKTLALTRKEEFKNDLWEGAEADLFHRVPSQPRGHEYNYERCWVKWKNVLNNYWSDFRKGKNYRYKSEVEAIIGSPKISGNKRPGNNEYRSNKRCKSS